MYVAKKLFSKLMRVLDLTGFENCHPFGFTDSNSHPLVRIISSLRDCKPLKCKKNPDSAILHVGETA
jgi:precorrin-6x reductase